MSDESEKAPEPHKRRWYQYSLRALLLVMVLLCFLFAWGGHEIRQAKRQKAAAVEWVKKMGGAGGLLIVEPSHYHNQKCEDDRCTPTRVY